MNKKNFLSIIFVIMIIILLGLAGYFALIQEPKTPSVIITPPPIAEEVELTNEIALSLLKNDLLGGECHSKGDAGVYRFCNINIAEENNQWIVVIIYDDLYDDSVRALRIQANLIYQEGQWVKGEISRIQQCQPGRGHQDFSSELCI